MAVQLGADVLRSALATLEQRDPQMAAEAEEAVESLAWRESKDEPLVFGQHGLQLFLWYVRIYAAVATFNPATSGVRGRERTAGSVALSALPRRAQADTNVCAG